MTLLVAISRPGLGRLLRTMEGRRAEYLRLERVAREAQHAVSARRYRAKRRVLEICMALADERLGGERPRYVLAITEKEGKK